LTDNWDAAAVRNDRERVDGARRAAEALFKPKDPATAPEPVMPAPTPTTDTPEPRRPRILAVQAAKPRGSDIAATPESAAMRPRRVGRPRRRVPPAEFHNIRTLARYGMTSAQLAKLHEVSVDEIDAILGGQDVR
jgi:hypothetical protein